MSQPSFFEEGENLLFILNLIRYTSHRSHIFCFYIMSIWLRRVLSVVVYTYIRVYMTGLPVMATLVHACS